MALKHRIVLMASGAVLIALSVVTILYIPFFTNIPRWLFYISEPSEVFMAFAGVLLLAAVKKHWVPYVVLLAVVNWAITVFFMILNFGTQLFPASFYVLSVGTMAAGLICYAALPVRALFDDGKRPALPQLSWGFAVLALIMVGWPVSRQIVQLLSYRSMTSLTDIMPVRTTCNPRNDGFLAKDCVVTMAKNLLIPIPRGWELDEATKDLSVFIERKGSETEAVIIVEPQSPVVMTKISEGFGSTYDYEQAVYYAEGFLPRGGQLAKMIKGATLFSLKEQRKVDQLALEDVSAPLWHGIALSYLDTAKKYRVVEASLHNYANTSTAAVTVMFRDGAMTPGQANDILSAARFL